MSCRASSGGPIRDACLAHGARLLLSSLTSRELAGLRRSVADAIPDAGGDCLSDLLSQYETRRLVRKWRQIRSRHGACAGSDWLSESELEKLLCWRQEMLRRLDPGPHGCLQIAASFQDHFPSWLGFYLALLSDPSWTSRSSILDGRRFDRSEDAQAFLYDRMGLAYLPFLHALREFVSNLGHTHRNGAQPLSVDVDAVARDLGLALANRFELATARALEAELNLSRASGTLIGQTATERYRAFLDRRFGSVESYQEFAERYPLLIRWYATVTGQWMRQTERCLDCLSRERSEIRRVFGIDLDSLDVARLEVGRGDFHAGGQSVSIIHFRPMPPAEGAAPARLVFKPRSVSAERGLQQLLEGIAAEAGIEFPSHAVLDGGDHGFVEHVDYGGRAASRGLLKTYAECMGGYAALALALGSTDLHLENIIVAADGPHIVDAETILDCCPAIAGSESAPIFESVLRSGLLEWPRESVAGEVHLSALQGDGAYRNPLPAPVVVDPGTDRLRVELRRNEPVQLGAGNRIVPKGDPEGLAGLLPDLQRGFDRVFGHIASDPERFHAQVREAMQDATLRFIHRGTQMYALVMDAIRHAGCLAEPILAELKCCALYEYLPPWTGAARLVPFEIEDLFRCDIPCFRARADEICVETSNGTRIDGFLLRSPLEEVKRRVTGFGPALREQQHVYIQASLDDADRQRHAMAEIARSHALRIGSQIAEALQDIPSSSWFQSRAGPSGHSTFNAALYDGALGVSLFLAGVSRWLDGDYGSLARRLFEMAAESRLADVGVFTGEGGLVFAAVHLAALLDDRSYLDAAVRRLDGLIPLISEDRALDLMSGAAGLILACAPLIEAGIETARRAAMAAGVHLKKLARVDERGAHWPHDPELAEDCLAGISHGLSGIGLALVELGCAVQTAEFTDLGRQAFRFEMTRFDPVRNAWRDLRRSTRSQHGPASRFANSWCNGAPGIGLARLRAREVTGDDAWLAELETAIRITMSGLSDLDNWCLCHGLCGHLDLLYQAGLSLRRPYLVTEVFAFLRTLWTQYEATRIWRGTGDGFPFGQPLGLMNGMAGMGWFFLRVATEGRAPSPLILGRPTPPDQSCICTI